MEEYIKAINKKELLSKTEESKLWKDYLEKGVKKARQELIQSYQPLVFKLACQYTDDRQLMMDLIQEGNIGLINAVESFEVDYGTNFSTFSSYYIRGRMLNYLEQGIVPELAYQDLYQKGPEEKAEKNCLMEIIKKAIYELPLKEQLVITKLYFHHQKPKNLACEMDISLSYLYRLQKKAFRRIRGKLSMFIKMWNQS